jgi:hypothetical protein
MRFFVVEMMGGPTLQKKSGKGKIKTGGLPPNGPHLAWAATRKWTLFLNFLFSTFEFQTKV